MIMFPGFRKRGLDDWLPGFLGSDTGNFSSCMNMRITNYNDRDQFLPRNSIHSHTIRNKFQ